MKRKRRPQPPGFTRIAKANKEFLEALNAEVAEEKYIEFEDATHTCWACGYSAEDFSPVRCHVNAHRQGGANSPENYVLLCQSCHKEQPDAVSKEVLEQWLVHHESAWERNNRSTRMVFEAIKAIARNRNAEGALNTYCDEGNARAGVLKGIAEKFAYESSAPSPRTHRANYEWGLVQGFVDWLDARRDCGAEKQTCLFPGEDDP